MSKRRLTESPSPTLAGGENAHRVTAQLVNRYPVQKVPCNSGKGHLVGRRSTEGSCLGCSLWFRGVHVSREVLCI